MIAYSRFELSNGLRVIVNEDFDTPLVAVNVLYCVGSRDENPEQTGFAHLFEHLMFSGSKNVPDFDDPIQRAGGENNAFTNTDFTNFYEVLPAENIETAFWLESDRMLSLQVNKKALEVQRKVVVEEFSETCTNQPYGDVWHHLCGMSYLKHPYRWPPIGLIPEHIEKAQLPDVKSFFKKFYRPNNAVLTISGPISTERVRELVEKWFGDIPAGPVLVKSYEKEPLPEAARKRVLNSNVPVEAIYLAFPMASRTDKGYYVADMLSDVLSGGPSARLHQNLVKDNQIFTSIDCYITESFDEGLIIIEGKPAEGISTETALAAIWSELHIVQAEPIPQRELEKTKNKIEANMAFSELNVLSKSMNLAYFEALGDVDLINRETDIYNSVTADDIQQLAIELFQEQKSIELIYKPDETNLNTVQAS